MAAQTQNSVANTIVPLLKRCDDDGHPVVLMTCGIAGSGKSTLAKTVVSELPHFTRLSIDEIIFKKHGLYGKDYPADEKLYQQYLEEADKIYSDTCRHLLREGKDLVLDRSFYAKEDRSEFKKIVEDAGGRSLLVYLKAFDKEELWKRICKRSAQEKEANSAYDISRDVFEKYWYGFEEPLGEGEVVVDVCLAQETMADPGLYSDQALPDRNALLLEHICR